MKTPFACALLLTVLAAYSQEAAFLIKDVPVRKGIVIKPFEVGTRLINIMDGIVISSKNDSCFATENGIISSTFNLGNQCAALIKAADGKYITYSNLRAANVKQGEIVKRGMFIGHLSKDEEDFQLLYILTDKNGREFTRDKHLQYLSSL